MDHAPGTLLFSDKGGGGIWQNGSNGRGLLLEAGSSDSSPLEDPLPQNSVQTSPAICSRSAFVEIVHAQKFLHVFLEVLGRISWKDLQPLATQPVAMLSMRQAVEAAQTAAATVSQVREFGVHSSAHPLFLLYFNQFNYFIKTNKSLEKIQSKFH